MKICWKLGLRRRALPQTPLGELTALSNTRVAEYGVREEDLEWKNRRGEGREEKGGTKGRGKEGKGMEGDKWRNGNEPDQVWEGIHTLAFTLEQQVFEVEQYASA